MKVNGAEVTTDKVRLFPGTYQFASDNEYIGDGDELYTISSPSDYSSTTDLKPTLTPAGEEAFTKTAVAALKACVKKKELSPDNCPFGIRPRSGQKIDKSTIKWALDGKPFPNLKLRLAFDNPAIAESSSTVKVKFTARGTQDGRSAKFGPQKVSEFTRMTMDMTKTKDPLAVDFG